MRANNEPAKENRRNNGAPSQCNLAEGVAEATGDSNLPIERTRSMSALLASLPNFKTIQEAQQHPVDAPKRKTVRADSRTLRFPGPERTEASPAVREEWALVQRAICGDSRAKEQIFIPHTTILYRIAEHIRQLPPRLREALQLCGLDGLSTEDSSHVLGIRRSAFKSRIARARQRLANGLQQSFRTPTSSLSRVAAQILSSEIVCCSRSEMNPPVLRSAACE
jgi:predicted DNA-binding protein (UPF0251 family)